MGERGLSWPHQIRLAGAPAAKRQPAQHASQGWGVPKRAVDDSQRHEGFWPFTSVLDSLCTNRQAQRAKPSAIREARYWMGAEMAAKAQAEGCHGFFYLSCALR